MRQRLVVLISGAGSNLASLLENLPVTQIPADVVAVGSDTNAPGLQHAAGRGIPTFVVPWEEFSSRAEWGVALGDALAAHEPDLIILSGFMKLLPPELVSRFSPRILNTHPAYLPEFPGAHAVREALASGATETGASVIVVDEGVDTGQILAQRRVPVEPGDDEAALHARIKVVERELLLQVLENMTTAIGT
ncbi:MAG: phosphoribosylglycinamide formyltransferase [Actinomycetota bacterium]|nr:phosphoribosylglycinamide formyltransferase [Actinomycetota bacterium]